jgi:hypothetical protein
MDAPNCAQDDNLRGDAGWTGHWSVAGAGVDDDLGETTTQERVAAIERLMPEPLRF